jgi:hypothetical protein
MCDGVLSSLSPTDARRLGVALLDGPAAEDATRLPFKFDVELFLDAAALALVWATTFPEVFFAGKADFFAAVFFVLGGMGW